MKKLALLALALGSLAVACTPPTTIYVNSSSGESSNEGGNGGGGSGGSSNSSSATTGGSDAKPTAHDKYVKEVHPSVIETCGGCHNPDGQVGAPAFLDYDPELSYPMTKDYPDFLVDPASSLLVNKEPHTGPALSDTQKELVASWITMELQEGGGTTSSSATTASSSSTGGGGGPTLEEMLASFAACMDFDVWKATGMDLFPTQSTNGEGQCMSCHNSGVGAVWLSGDPLETFEMNQQFPYIMRLVTPIYEGNNPVDLAPSNRLINKGVEECLNPPICHPKFNLTAENKAALEDFVGGTLQKWQSGACGQP